MDLDKKDAMHFLFGHVSLDEHFNDQGGSLSGDEIAKTFDSDADAAEIQNPVADFLRKCNENRFEKSGSTFDTTWDEQLADVVEKQYHVGGQLLLKGEISSRMSRVLAQIRSFCSDEEAIRLEKAIRCLDFALFGELAEPVLSRMRHAIT